MSKEKVRNIVVTDPIADMLTRVRNALNARHESVSVPVSKMKSCIAKILLEEGYLSNVAEADKMLKLDFKMNEGKQRVIQGLRRISKPGLRVYSRVEDLPRVLNGLGIAIISTSKGVMTDAKARESKLGGEVLAYVW